MKIIAKRFHIVLSLFLLFSTTEYLWARHLVDKQDPCELLEKEIEEDSELKEKEGEQESRRKSNFPDASFQDGDLTNSKLPATCLIYDQQLSAASKIADRKLYLIFHRFKLHS